MVCSFAADEILRLRAQNDTTFADALDGPVPASGLAAWPSGCSGWPRRRMSPRGVCQADLSF
jgi:hypothetical protein